MDYKIRTATNEKTGETLYCAYDIAESIGYKSLTTATTRTCKGQRLPAEGKSGYRYMKFMTKDEVYTFLSKSILESSKDFKLWFDDFSFGMSEKSEKSKFTNTEKEMLHKILAVLVATIEEIEEGA